MKWLEPVSTFDRSLAAREDDLQWQQMGQPSAVYIRPMLPAYMPGVAYRMPPDDDGREIHAQRGRKDPEQKRRRFLTEAEQREIITGLKDRPRAVKGTGKRRRANPVYQYAARFGVGVSSIYDVLRKGAA